MNICVVRHGETDWNRAGKWQGREDIPLNETGKQQAEYCGDTLKHKQWDAIFSSPLKRAKETADIIAQAANIPSVVTVYDLIERDLGAASGLTPEERKRLFPDGKYPGMENWDRLKNRVHKAILKCTDKSNGGDIIIVSHGGSINSVLAHLSNHKIGTGKTPLQNGCFTMLEYTGGVLKIVYYNKSAGEVDFG